MEPNKATFELSASADVVFTVTGAEVSDILTDDDEYLDIDLDYSILGTTVTIFKEYIGLLPIGFTDLWLVINGNEERFRIYIE